MPFFPQRLVTSDAYDFNPSNAEVIVAAYARIGIRRPDILSTHISDAVMELNTLFARMNNMGPNLWTVQLVATPLTHGVATYSLPAETIMVMDVFIRFGAPPMDRILYPLSRSEFASLSNKTQQGFPSQFWFNRNNAPTLTFYLTPDSNGPYVAYYYLYRQIQDSRVENGMITEVPPRWIDAIISGLAHRLARIYAPQLEQTRKLDADESWQIAATQDTENVPLYIMPGLGGYWRL